jgi:hypothetical protein
MNGRSKAKKRKALLVRAVALTLAALLILSVVLAMVINNVY